MSYHFDTKGKLSNASLLMIIDNISLVNEKGLESTILCTITKNNYDKVIEIMNSTINFETNSIRFFNYLKTKNSLSQEGDLCLDDTKLSKHFK